ncbi:MAG: hypothetical protein ACIARR_11245 [Phycisphaerales bacterium JB059]
MGSSFKGLDLFGSGPHRFVMGRQGLYAVPLSVVSGDPAQAGSSWFGDLELEVHVLGRLVGESEGALWALRDAITAQAESSNTPVAGTLVDGHGRAWDSMSLYRYEETGPTDRGRVWSVGYVARFRRFIGT